MLHKLSAVNQKHFSIFLNFPLFPFEESKRIITISNNHLKRGWNHRCFEKIFSPIFFFSKRLQFLHLVQTFVKFIFTVCSPDNAKKSENDHKSWGNTRVYTETSFSRDYFLFLLAHFPYCIYLFTFSLVCYLVFSTLFHRSYIILLVRIVDERLMVGNY